MSAKTADGGKADPGTAVGRIDAPDGFGHLFFGDAGADESLKLRHAVIVDLGGSPHGLLLGSVFYGAGIVAGGGSIAVSGCRVQLYQPEQEPGRPILINAQRLVPFQPGQELCRGVLAVRVVFHRDACLRRAEQRVDEETVVPVGPEQQSQHPLTGLDAHPGQIKDRGRVADDHLGQALSGEVFGHPCKAGCIECFHVLVILSVIFIVKYLVC